MSLYYEEPLYRPPSEADSLLIQATVGCAFAHCTYCISSVTGRFAIRPLAEIKQDLVEARRQGGEGSSDGREVDRSGWGSGLGGGRARAHEDADQCICRDSL